MSNTIKDIFYTFNFNAEISDQPLIHGTLNGRLDIYFIDGRVIDKVEMIWDKSPYINLDKRLNGYEVEEVNMLLVKYEKMMFDNLGVIINKIESTVIKGMIPNKMGKKTVLLPIDVPDNNYCWSATGLCKHFHREKKEDKCDLGLSPLKPSTHGIMKPEQCRELEGEIK